MIIVYHNDNVSYRIIPQLVVAICTGSEACATNTSARSDGATDSSSQFNQGLRSNKGRSKASKVKVCKAAMLNRRSEDSEENVNSCIVHARNEAFDSWIKLDVADSRRLNDQPPAVVFWGQSSLALTVHLTCSPDQTFDAFDVVL